MIPALAALTLVTAVGGQPSADMPADHADELTRISTRIDELTQSPASIAQAEEFTRLLDALDRLGEANPDVAEIEHARSTCLRRLARYPEERAAFARYATLTGAGDRAVAGRLLEAKAAENVWAGEIAHAVALHRTLISGFRTTRSAARAHLRIADVLTLRRADVKGALREYRSVLRDFGHTKEAELVEFELIKRGINIEEVEDDDAG